jgi:hypothetical protein
MDVGGTAVDYMVARPRPTQIGGVTRLHRMSLVTMTPTADCMTLAGSFVDIGSMMT